MTLRMETLEAMAGRRRSEIISPVVQRKSKLETTPVPPALRRLGQIQSSLKKGVNRHIRTKSLE